MKDKTAWLLEKKNYVLVIEKDILLEYDRKKWGTRDKENFSEFSYIKLAISAHHKARLSWVW